MWMECVQEVLINVKLVGNMCETRLKVRLCAVGGGGKGFPIEGTCEMKLYYISIFACQVVYIGRTKNTNTYNSSVRVQTKTACIRSTIT